MASTDTPLMRQYLEVKSRYPDSLVFFRMGDFYELFFEDALVAAKAVDIALTSRNKNDPDPVPMCGFPHHSAANYINRLVSLGHKVAICEQLEDPATIKGTKAIVKRDVIRVISPGTRLDPDTLDAKAPNYTHAVSAIGNGAVHWATCEFTTGKFFFGHFETSEAWLSYAQALAPAEVLFSETESGKKLFHTWRENAPHVFAQTVPAFYFEESYACDRLKEQFDVASLNAVHPKLATRAEAAGALVKYFQETQKAPRIPSVLKIELWGQDQAMELDPMTVKALELLPTSNTHRDVSLLSFLDRTKTAMGGRLMREWLLKPLTSIDAIEVRLDQVSALAELPNDLQNLSARLNEIYDLERLLSRVSLGSGTQASAREVLALAQSIVKSEELSAALSNVESMSDRLHGSLDPELLELSKQALREFNEKPPVTTREGGIFKKGFHAQLDELIELSENGEAWLAKFEASERESTKINSLKVRFNRVFGYYIEITKANLNSVPAHYIRKQTMVGGERFITEELKTFEEKILTADKKRCDMEHALFREYCSRFAALAKSIAALAAAVAHIDAISSLSHVASEEGYIRPELNDSLDLDVVEGRHPTVEKSFLKSNRGASFVPNSVQLNDKGRFLLITGPNMGGKSTVMRQTALIALMAQIGSFVPATQARFGIVDRIFTRIGASDNIAEGSSTFMVEMSEMSFILRHATRRSLILIDEIGRGTSTYDGMSLAWALASDIAGRIGSRTLFATHYHELTQLAHEQTGVINARVAVAVNPSVDAHGPSIRFLYRLEAGIAERSYGILVAKLAGLPREVLNVAESMLENLESQSRKLAEASGSNSNQLFLKLNRRRSPSPATPSQPTPAKVESAVESWLKTLELDNLTPMQVMSQLADWKKKMGTTLSS